MNISQKPKIYAEILRTTTNKNPDVLELKIMKKTEGNKFHQRWARQGEEAGEIVLRTWGNSFALGKAF